MHWIHRAFDFVCGSTQVWAPGGTPLPFCQRCTGLYVGGVIALVAYTWIRPRPSRFVLWLHGGLLLLMLPFGYHWVPQDGIVRTATGFLFASGLVYYLLLALPGWVRPSRHAPAGLPGLMLIVGLVAVVAAARHGGPSVATALSLIGFLGLLAYAILVAASSVLVPLGLRSAFRREHPR